MSFMSIENIGDRQTCYVKISWLPTIMLVNCRQSCFQEVFIQLTSFILVLFKNFFFNVYPL